MNADVSTSPMKWQTRIANLFVSPSKCMESLKVSPKWKAAFIICVVLTMISMPTALSYAQITHARLAEVSEFYFGFDYTARVLGEDAPTSLLTDGAIGQTVSFFVRVLLLLIGPLLAAAVLYLMTKIAGGTGQFDQYYAMFMYLQIFVVIGAMTAATLGVYLEHWHDFTALSAFVMPDGDVTMFNFNIFASITVFGTWAGVLAGVGVKIMNTFNREKVLLITGLFYVLSVLFSASMMWLYFAAMRWTGSHLLAVLR